MSLQLIGVSYKTAAIDARESIAFDPTSQKLFLERARAAFPGSEWFMISTCNRTECYWILPEPVPADLSELRGDTLDSLNADGTPCGCPDSGDIAEETAVISSSQQVIAWLHQTLPLTQTHAYQASGLAVVRHLLTLLCGLDSMVLGESQIVAQVKSAIDIARSAHSLGKKLNILLQQSLRFAKRIRRQTGIGDSPTSVAYTAVSLARSIFSDLAPLHVLLIGAGATAELTAWHLRQQGVSKMTILNRQVDKANLLAEKWQCQSASLDSLSEVLPHADIVISATSSPDYILTHAMVSEALAKRRRPLYCIDLAIPRDVDPLIDELTQVYLYNIDDLEQVVAAGLRERQQAAMAAEPLIQAAVETYAAHDAKTAASDTILSLQAHAQTARDLELTRAKAMLARGEDIDAVLQQLTHRLSNKLLHQTLMLLKQLS